MESLIDNLKAKIKAQPATVAELERRAGVPNAIINILHGRSKNPTIRVAQAIAKELGCTVDSLLTPSASNPSRDFLWQSELGSKVFHLVQQTLDKLKISCSLDDCLNYIKAIYCYTLDHPEQKLDPHFVTWYLERFAKPAQPKRIASPGSPVITQESTTPS